jgi:hypothetical protein
LPTSATVEDADIVKRRCDRAVADYLIRLAILKIGRYRAMTIPPITTPRKAISRGSATCPRAFSMA